MTHQFLKLAAASAIVALTATSTPVRADEMVQNLGPVGPHQPILTTVGSKRVMAFYIPGENSCAVQAIVWNVDEDTTSPARLRISLKAGAMIHIDSPDNKSLNLKCGDFAETLAVIDNDLTIASK